MFILTDYLVIAFCYNDKYLGIIIIIIMFIIYKYYLYYVMKNIT